MQHGSILTADNLILRPIPEDGIQPYRLRVIGKKIAKDLQEGDILDGQT